LHLNPFGGTTDFLCVVLSPAYGTQQEKEKPATSSGPLNAILLTAKE
jgi:hypothetical protein